MRSIVTLRISTLLGNALASANPPAGIISHAMDTSNHNPFPATQVHHLAARDGPINPESKPDSAGTDTGTGTGTGINPTNDALKADIPSYHHQIKRDDTLPFMRPESEPDSNSNSNTGTGTIDPAADAFKAGGDVHKIGNRAVSGGKCPTCVCQCPPAVNAAAGGRSRSGVGRILGVALAVFGVGIGFLGL